MENANITDKQIRFITWLITKLTDQCTTVEEVRRMNEEIRQHAAGLKEEPQKTE